MLQFGLTHFSWNPLDIYLADIVKASVPLLRLSVRRSESCLRQQKWTLGGPLHRRCPNDPKQDMSGRPAHDR